MIHIIPAEKRHFTDMDWLQTYWLFSFANYHDPENINHGSLRVFNDDVVQPRMGFGLHPHEEMEIVSIVLEGEMEHKDTMGNTIVVKKHDVQRMTAGTGLQHSEWNRADKPVRFFQIWFTPDTRGLQPSYDQKTINPESLKNRLALLASDGSENGAVSLNTDARLYRAVLDGGKGLSFTPESGRHQFIYVIEGDLKVNGLQLNRRDQARVNGEQILDLQADSTADFILIDNP